MLSSFNTNNNYRKTFEFEKRIAPKIINNIYADKQRCDQIYRIILRVCPSIPFYDIMYDLNSAISNSDKLDRFFKKDVNYRDFRAIYHLYFFYQYFQNQNIPEQLIEDMLSHVFNAERVLEDPTLTLKDFYERYDSLILDIKPSKNELSAGYMDSAIIYLMYKLSLISNGASKASLSLVNQILREAKENYSIGSKSKAIRYNKILNLLEKQNGITLPITLKFTKGSSHAICIMIELTSRNSGMVNGRLVIANSGYGNGGYPIKEIPIRCTREQIANDLCRFGSELIINNASTCNDLFLGVLEEKSKIYHDYLTALDSKQLLTKTTGMQKTGSCSMQAILLLLKHLNFTEIVDAISKPIHTPENTFTNRDTEIRSQIRTCNFEGKEGDNFTRNTAPYVYRTNKLAQENEDPENILQKYIKQNNAKYPMKTVTLVDGSKYLLF